jgi:hypothetical protein
MQRKTEHSAMTLPKKNSQTRTNHNGNRGSNSNDDRR